MKSRRFSSDRQLLDVEAKKIVLKNGAKGTGVANVQAFLHLFGNRLPKSIKQGQADGIFGAETESFVKKFQTQLRLKVDGIVGPVTLAAMDQVLVDKPVLDTASPVAYSTDVMAGSGRPFGDRPVYFV
jgi:peptidoglycan hydrolase-like protein with peptidoglycan-binding domain